jgi:hypothetical protein
MPLSPAREKKELSLGYALWCLSLVGICGVQRMYLGQVGMGIALLFTFGFCGVAQLLDLILLPEAVKQANKHLGFSDHESAAPATPSRSIPTSRAPNVSTAIVSLVDDDDLDQLLQQAEISVNRTENPIDDF